MVNPYYELEGKKYVLSISLIKKQGLTQKQVDKIKDLNIERLMTEAQLEKQYSADQIRAWYNVWEQIQFDLQKAWKFPKDSTYHPSHRLLLCSCPTSENDDRLGHPDKIYSPDCKLHNALRGKNNK